MSDDAMNTENLDTAEIDLAASATDEVDATFDLADAEVVEQVAICVNAVFDGNDPWKI